MSNPTIGFIGYGNMAQAIAEGLVAAGAIDGTDIVACAAHYDKLEKTTAKVGATPLRTAAEVADAADVVIIAIKPYQIESVIKPIAGALANESTFVVSIAAGWDLARYRELFGADFGAMHMPMPICAESTRSMRLIDENSFSNVSFCASVSVLSVSVTSTPLPTAIGVFGIVHWIWML